MADHSAPTVSTAYATYTTNLKDRIDDVCKGLDTGGTYVALPTNSIGWNSTNNKWQKWSGTAWNDLVATTASYTININGTIGQNGATALGGSFSDLSATGAVTGAGFTARFATPGPIGTGIASTGAFSTLSTTGIAALFTGSTVGTGTAGSNNIATLGGGEILTNKTLTTPIMSIIWSGSSATPLTLPVATDTLVGRNTGDTLTNKNLTSPKIGTAILDTNGAVLVNISPTASAANYITIANAVAGGTVTITAAGNANAGINLVKAGTGTIQVNGFEVADLSSSQSISNKTFSGTFSGNLTGNVTGNCSGSAATAGTATTAGTAGGLSITLPIANGGTNTTTTPTAGAVAYGTGTAIGYTAVGTAGQVLLSAAGSAPTWSTLSGANITNATISAAKLDGAQSGSAPIYGCRAWVDFDGTVAGTFAGGATTFTRVSGSPTCSCTTTNPHGLITGNVIANTQVGTAPGLAGYLEGGGHVVTVTGTNTFTITSTSTIVQATGLAITINVRSIRASGNVSSVAYGATGNYLINFAIALPDSNHAVISTCSQNTGVSTSFTTVNPAQQPLQNGAMASISAQNRSNDAYCDIAYVNVVIFR